MRNCRDERRNVRNGIVSSFFSRGNVGFCLFIEFSSFRSSAGMQFVRTTLVSLSPAFSSRRLLVITTRETCQLQTEIREGRKVLNSLNRRSEHALARSTDNNKASIIQKRLADALTANLTGSEVPTRSKFS